jgi:ribosome maturation protein Sdo1
LGRSKYSKATKKKIAACINRKAKQLGCKVTKKAKADIKLTSDIFKSTKELVEESIKNPGVDLY